jgi:hypothetical protein
VGGGAFGCRVFRHLGFAHARCLRSGIGRLASTTDSFGSACDSNPERRVSVGIRLDHECTLDPDVGCVFDIYFGLAKVTASDSFISSSFLSGSNIVGIKHIRTEIRCGANTARGHSCAYVRGVYKSQRDVNRLHARPSARIQYCLRVRISVAGVRIDWDCVRLRARLRIRACIRLRACGRTGASRQLGSSNRFGRFGRPPRRLGKANIRDVSRRQTHLGAVRSNPHCVARRPCNGYALRDGRKISAEVGDTNNTASTARARRLATARSEGTAAAGKARKLAGIGSPSNPGRSSNIDSFGGIGCLDRTWTGPRSGTNISRRTDTTNIGRTGVSSSGRRSAFCSAHGHRHRIDVSDLAPVRSDSRASPDRSNTLRCGV